MNKTIFYIFLFCFPYQEITAQPFGKAVGQWRIARMDYENSLGEKGCTYFSYDNSGLLSEGLWILSDSSRYSANFYKHDSQSNITSTHREFSDGLESWETFIFNSEGLKIEEHFKRSDSISGSGYYYYREGRLVEADLQKYKGWLSGRLEYIYNDEGRLTEAKLSLNEKPYGKVFYIYDEMGKLEKETWDFNGEWKQVFTYVYEKIGDM